MRALLALVLVATAVAPAWAVEYADIVPGTSTQADVRARHGAPTKSVPQKVDGFDTVQWAYEGTQAPVGTRRMAVDFGLKNAAGFRAEVVRDVRLDLQPGAFNQSNIIGGWGMPTLTSPPGHQPPTFVYASGLIVYFDKNGWMAESMLFTPPQPPPPAAPTPR